MLFLLIAVTILLAILKVAGVVAMSWWFVMAPALLVFIFWTLIMSIVAAVTALVIIFSKD
jgi:hypothetical protein